MANNQRMSWTGNGSGGVRANGKGREPDAKIRKEQELLHQRLVEQQEQQEMDRLWLEGRDTSKRDSVSDGREPFKPTSVQLGKGVLDIDDIIERKLAKKPSPSPLRKSLPLDNSGFLPLPSQTLSASVSSPI